MSDSRRAQNVAPEPTGITRHDAAPPRSPKIPRWSHLQLIRIVSGIPTATENKAQSPGDQGGVTPSSSSNPRYAYSGQVLLDNQDGFFASFRRSRVKSNPGGNWTACDSQGSSPTSQLKHRLIEIRDVVGSSAAKTRHKIRTRKDSIVSTLPRDGAISEDHEVRCNTNLSAYDFDCPPLHHKLYREIRNNRFDNNKTGFLPRSQLVTLLSTDVVANELKRSDSFLGRNHKKLGRLRFPFHNHPGDGGDVILQQACRIHGIFPVPSSPGREETANYDSNSSRQEAPKSYLKILAILILIERPARIKLFVDAGVSDDDLPLVKQPPEGRFALRRKHMLDDPLECFETWSDTSIARFEEWQWAFLAPVFESPQKRIVPHRQFGPDTVLPFRFATKQKARTGGFGTVRKVAIHCHHREFNNEDPENWYFAVKTLKNGQSEADFKREVATLRRLSGNIHDHLISLLGTYEKDGAFHLIFPWAEADLFDFWKRDQNDPAPPCDQRSSDETLTWVARQCLGLAEGLAFIHRYETSSGRTLRHPTSFPIQQADNNITSTSNTPQKLLSLFGRHGDIKPENILWFPNAKPSSREGTPGNGILKISDFGFAEFSSKEMVDKGRRGFVAESLTYSPPESVLDTELVSPSYDIWSLGCVYLEFITWFLGGWKRVVEFGNLRLEKSQIPSPFDGENTRVRTDVFYGVTIDKEGKRDAHTKESVIKFIGRLKQDSIDCHFIPDFLELIEKSMLVVERSTKNATASRKSSKNIGLLIEEMWGTESTSEKDLKTIPE